MSVEDVERALCLDLNLGDKYDNLILSCLKVIFENNDIRRFSSFYLKALIAVCNNWICERSLLIEFYEEVHFSVVFRESSNLPDETREKIEFIINMIYVSFPDIDISYTVDFGEFVFSINKSAQLSETENHLPEIKECETVTLANSELSCDDEKSLEEEHLRNMEDIVKDVGKKF